MQQGTMKDRSIHLNQKEFGRWVTGIMIAIVVLVIGAIIGIVQIWQLLYYWATHA